MRDALITFKTPENHSDCNELSCGNCSILYDTQHGANLPQCFYHEKSMLYLQMMAVAN